MATLSKQHEHESSQTKQKFKKDVLLTFQLSNTTFYNLKNIAIIVDYDKINYKDSADH